MLVAEGGAAGPLVKLVDFGISTLARTAVTAGGREGQPLPLGTGEHAALGTPGTPPPDHITATGIAIGTPMYMAPECTDRILGARPLADVFSFGVIAYELLVGNLPFERPAVISVSRGEPLQIPPLRGLRPELRPELAELLSRCLAVVAEERPSSAELAAALS